MGGPSACVAGLSPTAHSLGADIARVRMPVGCSIIASSHGSLRIAYTCNLHFFNSAFHAHVVTQAMDASVLNRCCHLFAILLRTVTPLAFIFVPLVFFALWLLCLSNVDIGVRSLAVARVFG